MFYYTQCTVNHLQTCNASFIYHSWISCFKILSSQRSSRLFLYKSLLTQYFASHKIKKIEMGGACGTNGGGEKSVAGFDGKPFGKSPLEDPSLDGSIIISSIFINLDVGLCNGSS